MKNNKNIGQAFNKFKTQFFMCSLLKSFSQSSGSSLNIEVDYDPKNDEVVGIKSVYVMGQDLKMVDITEIIGERFEDIVEKAIKDTDWRELYLETKYEAA